MPIQELIQEIRNATIQNKVTPTKLADTLQGLVDYTNFSRTYRMRDYLVGAGYFYSLTDVTAIRQNSAGTARHRVYHRIPAGATVTIKFTGVPTGSSYCFLQANADKVVLQSVRSSTLIEQGATTYTFTPKDVETTLYISQHVLEDLYLEETFSLNEILTSLSMESGEHTQMNVWVDGDSISALDFAWPIQLVGTFKEITNFANGRTTWSARRTTYDGVVYTTQEITDPNYAGYANVPVIDSPQAAQQYVNNCARVHLQTIIKRYHDGEVPRPDVAVFFLGTNDFYLGDVTLALAPDDPWGDAQKETMCGGIRYCVETMRNEFPWCKLFVVNVLQRAKSASAATPTPAEKNQVISELCRELAVEVIDVYANSGISKVFEKDGEQGLYLTDGLHPTADTSAIIGAYIKRRILASV